MATRSKSANSSSSRIGLAMAALLGPLGVGAAPGPDVATVVVPGSGSFQVTLPEGWEAVDQGAGGWVFSDVGAARAAGGLDVCSVAVTGSDLGPGWTMTEVRAQLPRSFAGGQLATISGEPAMHMAQDHPKNAFTTESIYILRDGTLHVVTARFPRERPDCQAAWSGILGSWTWD